MTVFRAATLGTFFFAFHAGAKELMEAYLTIWCSSFRICAIFMISSYFGCTIRVVFRVATKASMPSSESFTLL